jgi:hypothetical protein
MKPLQTSLAAAFLTTLSMSASAVTEDNFLAKTTGDMIALCSADNADSMHTAAVNFCHGFVVGAYRVLAAEDETLGANKAFCPPATLPSRNEAIANFIQWAKSNPSVESLPPTDGMLKFLMANYPCGK